MVRANSSELYFLFLYILCAFLEIRGFSPQTRRILPADSYQIIGDPGFRLFGLCNITYAWLQPPPAWSLDAYSHALACSRLQLQDGSIVENALDHSADAQLDGQNIQTELNSINKELKASMVDINRLHALMRAEHLVGNRRVPSTGKQLAESMRSFYLADRIGNFNLLVLLRPGQQPKIHLIDPISTEHSVTPEHVLCSRKQCPIAKPPISPASSPSAIESENNSHILNAAFIEAKKHNRELYLQLIISRVACALLSFLCVVFAITALALCIRLRRIPDEYRKQLPSSQLNVCREPHPSPTYCQANGKLGFCQPSPMILTDASPRHMGYTPQLASETTSVNNLVMTASNLSECGAIPGTSISYALNTPYGPVPGYPGRGNVYSDSSGMLTFVPVNSRGVLLPYQNGPSSPAPSNHSMSDTKTGVVRSESLGRHSGINAYPTIDNGRRKFVRLNRPVSRTVEQQQMDSDSRNPLEQSTNPNDLISFQSIHGVQQTGNMRFASDGNPAYPRVPTPCGSVHGDRMSNKSNLQMNNVNDPCVGLVRKPALVN